LKTELDGSKQAEQQDNGYDFRLKKPSDDKKPPSSGAEKPSSGIKWVQI
jgi:hypothetical protein